MDTIYSGKTWAYVSNDDEEIITISPSDDGSIAFLVMDKINNCHRTLTLTYDADARKWHSKIQPFESNLPGFMPHDLSPN